MNFPASLHSSTTAPVKSSGSPIPIGDLSIHNFRKSACAGPPDNRVFMMPGEMELTRMLCPTHSPAIERARWCTPALEIA